MVRAAMPALRSSLAALALLAALAATAGCGKGISGSAEGDKPAIGKKGDQDQAARSLGFPGFATKNTTRIGGADPTADAAGAAQAVFTAQSPATRPRAVALVDKDNWQAGIAASVLMASPLRAPTLLTDGSDVPGATRDALKQLGPRGVRAASGAQVVSIAGAAKPDGYEVFSLDSADDPAAQAAAIDQFQSSLAGRPSDRVIVASSAAPAFAMPAAGWAAKAGDPILYVAKSGIPAATQRALRRHQQPKIYVLGPSTVVPDAVLAALRKFGTVKRVSGPDPVSNAIAFARFLDGGFGWGVVDPGHGLVFANAGRPLDATAGAPLSSSGTYGPILLLQDAAQLPKALEQYLLDIQPGYDKDPVRGVYNHGWLIGDDKAISIPVQARIDSLLDIVPVDTAAPGQTQQ